MKDPIVYVKDTTAWTIGRICQLHPQTVSPYLANLITVLVEALNDNSRVAANACWVFIFPLYYNLCRLFITWHLPMKMIKRNQLLFCHTTSKDFWKNCWIAPFVTIRMKAIFGIYHSYYFNFRSRTSAYEAINVLIQSGAQDTHQLIMAATPVFIERLEKTFTMQVLI